MATNKKILPRKNKATPRTVEIILDAISCGLTQRDAATLDGNGDRHHCLGFCVA